MVFVTTCRPMTGPGDGTSPRGWREPELQDRQGALLSCEGVQCSNALAYRFTTDMIGFNSQRGLADDASKVCAEVQAGQGGDPHKTRSPARKLGKRGACHKKI